MDSRRLKRLFIDMDGVLCDYLGAFQKELKSNRHQKFPQSRWGFFLNLEPMPGAIEAVNLLQQNYDVWILSRPSVQNISCYSEKAYWVKNHLGFEMQEKLILCTNKSLLKGDYLIDDTTDHGQLDFEGKLLHYGSEQFPDWSKVTQYFKDEYVKSYISHIPLYGC